MFDSSEINKEKLNYLNKEYINTKQHLRFFLDFNDYRDDLLELQFNSLSALVSKNVDRTKIIDDICTFIIKYNHIYTTRDDKKPEVWMYQDGIYVPNGISYIKEITQLILSKAYTTQFANSIIEIIQVKTFIDEKDFFINEDINLIPLLNGIYDISKKKLIPFSHEYRFFNKINSNYDIKEDCPNIKKHFETVLQDNSDVEVMQELFGFVLLRDYRYSKAFMLNGGGENGKGKTLELLKLFINPLNSVNLSLTQLEQDKFCVADLFNKYANICDDLSKTSLKETGMFKQLTGKGMVSGDRKFRNRISFVNFAKMLFSSNELPITTDLTEAFFRRWIIIDFKYTFKTQAEYKKLTDSEKKYIKLADASIIKKLTTEKEMSGLFNWAIEGLERLIINKGFSKSKSTEETKKIWLRKSSSINGFIMDCLEESYESWISKEMLKTEYTKYCRSHKLITETDHVIKTAMQTVLGCSDTVKKINEMTKKVWLGVNFKNNVLKSTFQEEEQAQLQIESEQI